MLTIKFITFPLETDMFQCYSSDFLSFDRFYECCHFCCQENSPYLGHFYEEKDNIEAVGVYDQVINKIKVTAAKEYVGIPIFTSR